MYTDPKIHKNKSLEKCTRLKSDYAEMQFLNREIPCFYFMEYGGPSNFYRVKFDLYSIVQLPDKSLPKQKGFFFDITLPKDYPESPPRCLISFFAKIPFHPHIYNPVISGNLFILAEWVDFKEYDPHEGLGLLMLRIANSLKYDPNYIDISASKIGNHEALRWYINNYKASGNMFPIDKTEIPEKLSTEKFGIVPKKFVIVGTTKSYQPMEIQTPEFSIISESSVSQDKSDETHRLYITFEAMEQIKKHIVWGKETITNRVEQGGILLGRAYKDTKKNLIFVIVDQSIAGRLAKGSRAYLRMDHITWKEMIDYVDKIIDSESKGNLQIIGWYHTHPAELPVFMSGTDRDTQRCIFSKEWHFAIVLNPHKKIWRAYYGADSRECKGFLLKTTTNLPQ